MIGDTRYRITEWGKTGAYEGAKLGFLIGYRYMFVTTIFFALLAALALIGRVIGEGDPGLLTGVFAGVAFLLVVWLVGFVIGVLPAAFVGAVIGGIVGSIVALPSIYDSPFLRRTVSLGISLLIMLLAANPVFDTYKLILIDVLSNPMFWYFVGVPLLFCIGAMVWMSDRLPTLAATPMPYETIAGERPVLPPLWLD